MVQVRIATRKIKKVEVTQQRLCLEGHCTVQGVLGHCWLQHHPGLQLLGSHQVSISFSESWASAALWDRAPASPAGHPQVKMVTDRLRFQFVLFLTSSRSAFFPDCSVATQALTAEAIALHRLLDKLPLLLKIYFL